MRLAGVIAAGLSALPLAGCGEVARNGRAPAQLVIVALEGASGAEPEEFGGTVSSDVLTIVERDQGGVQVQVPTVFGDIGRVTFRIVLRDPGFGTPAAPSALNAITINRYRVVYRRADGRNTPGVDIPYPFDSALTFTVPEAGEATGGFTLVRITAKQEAPLAALITNPGIIATIAEITFYGHDQAGNEVIATGSIGVFFGNFGDPE